MELKLFGFIEEVLDTLEDMKFDLERISKMLEEFFEDLLQTGNRAYISIDSRVKSKKSLKEKIIRNHYYQKYDTKDKLFENVPDIIGIRLGCKFVEDEADIYKFIKKCFNEKYEDLEGFYYNACHPQIILKIGDKQPQEQKNGMKVYRIDGKYLTGDAVINFEMQIKSLVNIFWSEIEHKIIYKNHNYVIADKFYKDIMKSINNSLITIDQQLLLISNQFEKTDTSEADTKEEQLEKLLSKVIYDIFAVRMKDSIGVLVDFRKSCEAIVKYVFRDALNNDLEKYSHNLITGFDKVRQINEMNIDFKQKIMFERKAIFNDQYTAIIGNHISSRINEEFQWNLFFRILFELEVEDNIGDFETFMHYYTEKIYNKITLNKISANFTVVETKEILDEIMMQFAYTFIKCNTVDLLYDSVMEQAMKIINGVIDTLYKNILTYEQWHKEKDMYLDLLEVRLLLMFNIDIESERVLAFLDRVRATKSNIEVPKGMLKYIYKL